MQEYINYIIQITPFLLSGIGLFGFLYSCRKAEAQKGNKYFWAGMLTLSLPMLLAQSRHHILPNSEYALFFQIVSIACLVCGIYLTRKGSKMLKEASKESKEVYKATDISKPVGLVFGIITLPFSAISLFFALVSLIGIIMSGRTQMEWPLIIAWVLFGTISIFLSVAAWRLINAGKKLTNSLFSPYILWLRIVGWLFLTAGIIKLFQRNIDGLWAIVIAVALIFISIKKRG